MSMSMSMPEDAQAPQAETGNNAPRRPLRSRALVVVSHPRAGHRVLDLRSGGHVRSLRSVNRRARLRADGQHETTPTGGSSALRAAPNLGLVSSTTRSTEARRSRAAARRCLRNQGQGKQCVAQKEGWEHRVTTRQIPPELGVPRAPVLVLQVSPVDRPTRPHPRRLHVPRGSESETSTRPLSEARRTSVVIDPHPAGSKIVVTDGILERVGRGGMGVSVCGVRSELNRRIALKILTPRSRAGATGHRVGRRGSDCCARRRRSRGIPSQRLSFYDVGTVATDLRRDGILATVRR